MAFRLEHVAEVEASLLGHCSTIFFRGTALSIMDCNCGGETGCPESQQENGDEYERL